MNNENLFEAISEIDENIVIEADGFAFNKNKKNIVPYIVSVAAVFVIVAVAGFAVKSFGGFSVFEKITEALTTQAEDSNYSAGKLTENNTEKTEDLTAGIPSEITSTDTSSEFTTDEISEIPTEPGDNPVLPLTPIKLTNVSYPSRVQYPVLDFASGEVEFTEEYMDAINAHSAQQRQLNTLAAELYGIKGYSKSILSKFLTGKNGENKVVSPLNIYMALCMLAETSDGNTRKQILSLLGVSSIEQLRQQSNIIWQKNYRNDGVSKSVLSNSLWLNGNVSYKEETIENISEYYFADVYSGTMGTEEYDSILNQWLRDKTDGLLNPNEEMNYGDILMLASALTYKTKWAEGFGETTESGVFNSPSGSKNVEYMQSGHAQQYYWGESFSAVSKDLEIGGKIWFILPDEGKSADDIFLDSEVLNLITLSQVEQNRYANSKFLTVNMKVPEFDVSGKTDIIDGLRELGLTDMSDSEKADFSSLCDDSDGVFVSKGNHCVRVIADTEGISAAAYTVLGMAGSAPPPEDEVDFFLDRPFAFAVTLDNETILFAGIVNNP